MPAPVSLAIIPARGGSKRIPRKNIREFLGKPIIAYSIDAALKTGKFQTVMVSTDDSEIAEIARKSGAEAPFMRSERRSDDYSTLAEVIDEVLQQYEASGVYFDFFCCLLPTAPFATSTRIGACYERLLESEADSIFPVVRFGYPIQRALKIEDGRLLMNQPEHLTTRSNDLPPAFHDSGQFYWMRTSSFKTQKKLFADYSLGVEIPETECQDIDTEEDWKLAELKYRMFISNAQ